MRGDRLYALKTERGYSRKELAALLDISESNVPRYEKGEQLPSSDVIRKMAQLFNVTADYLVGLSDDPQPILKDAHFTSLELRMVALLREVSGEDQQKMLRVLEIMSGKGIGV